MSTIGHSIILLWGVLSVCSTLSNSVGLGFIWGCLASQAGVCVGLLVGCDTERYRRPCA